MINYTVEHQCAKINSALQNKLYCFEILFC